MIPVKSIDILGEEYEIRYPVSALIAAEHELGQPIASLGKNPLMGQLAIILRHGLSRDGKKLTRDDLAIMLEQLSATEFTDIVTETMEMIFPREAENTRRKNRNGANPESEKN
ncbi:MAG: gene transfer agent family protein [Methanocorpusculum parvum]|nr:gene transfer agent family protein [Methanocorpusculum parvum]